MERTQCRRESVLYSYRHAPLGGERNNARRGVGGAGLDIAKGLETARSHYPTNAGIDGGQRPVWCGNSGLFSCRSIGSYTVHLACTRHTPETRVN